MGNLGTFYTACGLLVFVALLTFALKDRKAEVVAPDYLSTPIKTGNY
jgi:hypothetical protein